jgi:hypothetical protein
MVSMKTVAGKRTHSRASLPARGPGHDERRSNVGVALVLISALSFGFLPTLVKAGYHTGLGIGVLAFRLAVVGGALLAVAWAREGR